MGASRLRYFAAVQALSLPKPRQIVCGRVRAVAHLHRSAGGGCLRRLPLWVVATWLLHVDRGDVSGGPPWAPFRPERA
jgi:hypothetical protein